MEHTFSVLAYNESEYLESCIESVLNQTVESKVIICTSTPNDFISKMAEKYNLEIKVNPRGQQGIGSDFDWGVEAADTELVTVAHQDDTYEPTFAEEKIKAADENTLIIFNDYHEIHNGVYTTVNLNLRVKRILLNHLKKPKNQGKLRAKRRAISMGNAICCPSVTFHKTMWEGRIFESEYKSNIDWIAWERLSKRDGKFIYIPKDLMMHRVHSESTTTKIINSNIRTKEDYGMFCMFWPKPIAWIMSRVYVTSERSNRK